MSVMDPRQRIGNAEREYATRELARHYADGRLDHEEYSERLDAVWTARTHDDLRELFLDLPRPVPVPVAPSRPPARRTRSHFWLQALAVLVVVMLALMVVGLLS